MNFNWHDMALICSAKISFLCPNQNYTRINKCNKWLFRKIIRYFTFHAREKEFLFWKGTNIFFLVDQRGTAHELFELPIKERKTFIPTGIGNLTDLHICFYQHLARQINTIFIYKGEKRFAKGLFEETTKSLIAHGNQWGNIIKPDLFVIIFLNKIIYFVDSFVRFSIQIRWKTRGGKRFHFIGYA